MKLGNNFVRHILLRGVREAWKGVLLAFPLVPIIVFMIMALINTVEDSLPFFENFYVVSSSMSLFLGLLAGFIADVILRGYKQTYLWHSLRSYRNSLRKAYIVILAVLWMVYCITICFIFRHFDGLAVLASFPVYSIGCALGALALSSSTSIYRSLSKTEIPVVLVVSLLLFHFSCGEIKLLFFFLVCVAIRLSTLLFNIRIRVRNIIESGVRALRITPIFPVENRTRLGKGFRGSAFADLFALAGKTHSFFYHVCLSLATLIAIEEGIFLNDSAYSYVLIALVGLSYCIAVEIKILMSNVRQVAHLIPTYSHAYLKSGFLSMVDRAILKNGLVLLLAFSIIFLVLDIPVDFEKMLILGVFLLLYVLSVYPMFYFLVPSRSGLLSVFMPSLTICNVLLIPPICSWVVGYSPKGWYLWDVKWVAISILLLLIFGAIRRYTTLSFRRSSVERLF